MHGAVIPEGLGTVYGITPGAAGPMMLLGEAEGADVHLAAFMQYSRALLVVLAAAFVARFWANAADLHPHGALWLTPVHWGNLVAVLLLAALAQQAARLLGFPVVGATLLLMALCTLLAWCLAHFAHVDALTAYLATSPGGLDSVAKSPPLQELRH